LKKIAIFVDVQNIYYTCRQAYKSNFDYNKFWAEVTRNRALTGAYAYATDRRDGSTKADWDIGIALDVYEEAPQCDTVVLATGDGDFGILLNRIKNRFNTDCEVYGVPALTSDLLIDEASKFVPIDERLLLM